SSRRRHTRCYRDWSSDVCSSDLLPPNAKDSVPRAPARCPARNRRALQTSAARSSRRRWRQCEPAQAFRNLPPEMSKRRRRSVFRAANPQLFADALAQLLVHGGNAGLAVQLNKSVPLGHHFEFAFDHRLVADKGPVKIVRQRHIPPRLPITDRLCFLELAPKRRLRPDVQPERQVRAQR